MSSIWVLIGHWPQSFIHFKLLIKINHLSNWFFSRANDWACTPYHFQSIHRQHTHIFFGSLTLILPLIQKKTKFFLLFFRFLFARGHTEITMSSSWALPFAFIVRNCLLSQNVHATNVRLIEINYNLRVKRWSAVVVNSRKRRKEKYAHTESWTWAFTCF